MKSFLAKLVSPSPLFTDIGLLALRLWLGLALLVAHGWGKFGRLDTFAAGLDAKGYPIPEVMAALAALSEALGGLFVAIGLLTRPAAFTIVVTMLVVVFVEHPNDWKKQELPITYAAMALGLMFAGAGRFSLDRLIADRLRKRA